MKKVPTIRFTVWIPATWGPELAARAAYESKKLGTNVTIQDLMRQAIIKTYYLARDEVMPQYPTLKPKDLVEDQRQALGALTRGREP